VQSLSDIIALASKTHQINRLLKQIRNQNHELIEKSNEIKILNEELSTTNEELTTMNESLEEAVKGRTQELELQNKQLTEYAFINSHLLRAPLARILGLSQLITRNKEVANDPKIINALIHSTDELDAITRRISELLYAGSNFNREEIKEIIDRNLNKK
jgi:signal transduction histidine kinase